MAMLFRLSSASQTHVAPHWGWKAPSSSESPGFAPGSSLIGSLGQGFGEAAEDRAA